MQEINLIIFVTSLIMNISFAIDNIYLKIYHLAIMNIIISFFLTLVLIRFYNLIPIEKIILKWKS